MQLRAYGCNRKGFSENSDTLSLDITAIQSNTQQAKFELYQNEPNPADGKTNIRYSINKMAEGKILIYDLSGRMIFSRKLWSKPGLNKFELETSQFGEGIYFYSLSFENQQQIKKLIIIR